MSAQDPLSSSYRSTAKDAPNEMQEIGRRKSFSPREVGLTHPDNSSFIRLNDAGDVEIFSVPGVGIVISGATRTISIFADNIRLHTKEDGLKWNSMDFNYSSDSFAEPTLTKSNPDHYNPAFANMDFFIESLSGIIAEDKQPQDTQSPVTINGDYQFADSNKDITDNYGFDQESESSSLFTDDQISIIKSSWQSIPLNQNQKIQYNEFIDYIANLMQSGYTFNQSKDKAIRDKSV